MEVIPINNFPGYLPRSKTMKNLATSAYNAGRAKIVFTANNYIDWFRTLPPDPFGIFTASEAKYQEGNYGHKNYILRPQHGVLFINSSSIYFGGFDIAVTNLSGNNTAISEIAEFLKDTGIAFGSGDANPIITESSQGNPYFPVDGWGNYELSPGSSFPPSWCWALTEGIPGNPSLIDGGDLLVFLVAWTDEGFVTPDLPVETYNTYHDGYLDDPNLPEGSGTGTVTTPTEKFKVHYNRFASLIPKLDRYHAVIFRNSDMIPVAKAEPILSAHFNEAVNGLGTYSGLGPSLNSFGVELMDITGSVSGGVCIDIIRDHFKLRK